jgi:hypothetical protein
VADLEACSISHEVSRARGVAHEIHVTEDVLLQWTAVEADGATAAVVDRGQRNVPFEAGNVLNLSTVEGRAVA